MTMRDANRQVKMMTCNGSRYDGHGRCPGHDGDGHDGDDNDSDSYENGDDNGIRTMMAMTTTTTTTTTTTMMTTMTTMDDNKHWHVQ